MQCKRCQSLRLSLGINRTHVWDSLYLSKLSRTYISSAVIADHQVYETHVEILHVLASARGEVGSKGVKDYQVLVRSVKQRLTQKGDHEKHQTNSVLVVRVRSVVFRLKHRNSRLPNHVFVDT